MVIVQIFGTCFLFLFSNNMLAFRAGIQEILVRIAKREDPDQTAFSDRSSLIWVCTVCLKYAFSDGNWCLKF